MAPEDEFRPVTVLFADIVGSTALGERLEPDEVKALIGECVTRMARAVERCGGTTQAYMGDGICAYFGVPSVHDDDPDRAATAALHILDLVRGYAVEVEAAWRISNFGVRVGVNTGRAAVGVVGSANPQDVALGDATNVAARLQALAEPGTVLVGGRTKRLLSRRFVVAPVGELHLKGRDRSEHGWQLIRVTQPAVTPPRTAFVGRAAELDRLRAALGESEQGRGQVVLIVGESGIGKTRLLREARSESSSVEWLEGQCLSYGGTDLGNWPFVEMFRGWLGLQEDQPEVAIRAILRAKAASLFGDRASEFLPSLGRVLGIRLGPDFQGGRDGANFEQGEAVRSALLAWVERLAVDGPVVIAFEDLHHAGSSTGQLAQDLLAVTDRAPLLLLATLRPELGTEAWALRVKALSEYAHRTIEIRLRPLALEESERLIDGLVPAALLDPGARREIALRAEGNPLYIEEVLNAMVERPAIQTPTWTLSASVPSLPEGLEGLLVSRIDRLPPGARRLAQLAAVVGRTFAVPILERLHGFESFDEDMQALFRSDVIREVQRFPIFECAFKHGLLQEAALSTLPKARLKELYGLVAAAVEDEFVSSIEDHVDLLAYYTYRSDDLPKALVYLERAAERALRLEAAPQALDLLTRARKVAARLNDGAAERRIEERLTEAGLIDR
jgi:class 3 adenylate cyclase